MSREEIEIAIPTDLLEFARELGGDAGVIGAARLISDAVYATS